MDEATLRFFEELGKRVITLFENGWWDVVTIDDINDLLDDHLPLLEYYGEDGQYELRIGGAREE